MKIYTVLTILILISCSKEKNDTKTDLDLTNKEYTYIADSTKIGFIAYKFTQKIGVKGAFDKIQIKNTQPKKNPYLVFENSEFEIDVLSINTADTTRDYKIITYFFNQLENTKTLTGKVISIDKNGNGVFSVRLNNIEKNITFTSSYINGYVQLNSEIDLNDFNAQTAIESLNEVCKLLHTGPDGILKLWPNISLNLNVFVN